MKGKIVSIIITFLCLFAFTACGNKIESYTSIHGEKITRLDTRNNRVYIEGFVPSALVLVKDYECRIEDNAMYIKILLTSHKDGEYKTIGLERDLPNSIEKIFIEDDKSKIMVWDKSQGYAEFDMQERWESELKKLIELPS